MQAWFLIYSKPRKEHIALDNLLRQGFHAYLPLFRARRRRRGRYRSAIEPMFPRYLFIHLDDQEDNWGPIRSTIGVVHLVRFGHYPARVPGELVGELKAREPILRAEPEELRLKKGDPVRIAYGAMAGYEAIFDCKNARERVTLLLEIAGKMARVQLDTDQIELMS